ncbi:hypothetical protein AVEN_228169-1 [Araneus ventricosus]|uniref:Uncharacterized protein n=1 Tax=Araneus ventricosus TaxID=182803 RepID=A0A4Y2CTD0_ARAVE|nr:hypothetical protein AVEN_228169-1 [Araneus ventricosus]
MDALHSLVEFNSLKPIASPLDSLPGVFFHTELLIYTNKSSQHPEYLRQAALEVINNIPIEATLIYTDGRKNEIGHTVLSNILIIGEMLVNEANELKTLCNCCVLHLQWIPSHVNLNYNDIADGLAKEGTTMPQANVEPLTYLELYSRRKAFGNDPHVIWE